MNIINTEINVGSSVLPNRIFIQPMEGCDGKYNGGISELTRRRYMRYAKSGVGLIWFEAVAVCAEGRANPRQLYLTEENLDEFKELIEDIKEEARITTGIIPVIIIQLTHSGRQSRPIDIPQPIYAGNNTYLNKIKPLPQNAKYADLSLIETVKENFVKSALLAEKAGFDGVDVKCCHGYLFHEFLSAYDRSDKFGGPDIENRSRLFMDTFAAVVKSVNNKTIISSRFGIYDGYPHSFGINQNNEADLTEAKYVISRLIENGLDLLNVTMGNPYINPEVNRPYIGVDKETAEKSLRRIWDCTYELQSEFMHLPIAFSALTYNGTDSMEYVESALNKGVCKLAGFGRMAFAYPEFYIDYLNKGFLDKNKVCITCGKCSQMMRAGSVAGCPIRDAELYMPIYKQYVK